MENNLILFGSMTAMMRARDLLRKNGIRSATVRTPAAYRRGSCGYSLRVSRDIDRAVGMLKQQRIPVLGVAAVDAL